MTGPDTSVTRWLLLCALAFCVVGTHHLGLSSHHEHGGPVVAAAHSVVATVDSAVDSVAGTEQPVPHRDGAETLLHLCLAMLVSVALFGAFLVRRRKGRRAPVSTPRHPGVRRAPPLPSPVVLRL